MNNNTAGVVQFSADLSPDALWNAYLQGLYPFPTATPEQALAHEVFYEEAIASGDVRVIHGGTGNPFAVAWCSPDPRPALMLARTRIPHSLRRRLAATDWTATINACFERVVEECRQGRTHQWINNTLADSLLALHHRGLAHSCEIWADGTLIGGLFGIRIGGVFSLDAGFHRQADAGKTAVLEIADRLRQADAILVDFQVPALRELPSAPRRYRETTM